MQDVLSESSRTQLLGLCQQAVRFFNEGDWQLLDIMAGNTKIITGHDRLLRSLSFGDSDYEGNAYRVLFDLAERNPANLRIIQQFIIDRYGEVAGTGENISTALSKSRQIVFTPSVFEVPQDDVDRTLVAVMTPFAPEFEPVFRTIGTSAFQAGLEAVRAKDIWQHSVVIQDVFSLIFRAHIVVCDFTGKNPNVFYEAGIAHTLGKHVVPITQAEADVPFDLRHHRFVHYLNNDEGRSALMHQLTARFTALR